jgi:hypothetical protein
MKINCGESFYTKCLKRQEWHSWFAWYPIRIADYNCRWLETVERKFEYGYGGDYFIHYRLPKEPINS